MITKRQNDLLLSAGLFVSLAVAVFCVVSCGQTGAKEQSDSTQVADATTTIGTPISESETVAPTQESTPTATPTPKINRVVSPRTDSLAYHAGVSVLVYSDGGDFAEKAPKLLDRLAELNINSVSLVFPVFQSNWQSVEVYKDPKKTPTDDNIRIFIREAHKRNFTVMLRPILDESSLVADGKWRGQLSPTDKGQWFNSYSSLLVGYAKLAQEEKVAVLNIGTEFVSLEPEVALWKALIAVVRTQYDGQITYSANWDVKAPGFASDLNFPSIDAYYPLDVPTGASVDSLVAGWQRWIADITSKGYDPKTVVFTEIGILPRQGAYQKPWNYLSESPADYEAQLRYYQATCQVFVPLINGLYWWQVDLILPDPNKPDLGFSPMGKPAEAALAQCHR